jgi:hypothetical protein
VAGDGHKAEPLEVVVVVVVVVPEEVVLWQEQEGQVRLGKGLMEEPAQVVRAVLVEEVAELDRLVKMLLPTNKEDLEE